MIVDLDTIYRDIFFPPSYNSPSGLLGAHVMADLLRQRGDRMQWYQDELLHMAKELGHRLLPAFNTTSGLPYPKVWCSSPRNDILPNININFLFVELNKSFLVFSR